MNPDVREYLLRLASSPQEIPRLRILLQKMAGKKVDPKARIFVWKGRGKKFLREVLSRGIPSQAHTIFLPMSSADWQEIFQTFSLPSLFFVLSREEKLRSKSSQRMLEDCEAPEERSSERNCEAPEEEPFRIPPSSLLFAALEGRTIECRDSTGWKTSFRKFELFVSTRWVFLQKDFDRSFSSFQKSTFAPFWNFFLSERGTKK